VRSFVVLLSGGLDSTLNLYEAHAAGAVKLALTFDYGQRAAAKEIQSASALAKSLDIAHQVLKLDWFSFFTKSSLVNRGEAIPVGKQISIDDQARSEASAKAVWVPNRNGIFLNIGAAFAEGLGATDVVPGFNIEEAATFPDNSEDFLDALSGSLAYSTGGRVKASCFTTRLNKTAIVRRGRELKMQFDLVWPCYFGGEKPCGDCESCQRFERAMQAGGARG
jgi:7-cyano-7-deazaguanine synthase